MKIFKLQIRDGHALTNLSERTSFVRDMVVASNNKKEVVNKYQDYTVEEIGIYTGRHTSPFIISRYIINF